MSAKYYNQPDRREYGQASAAFGATTDSQKFISPRGKRGLVRDITWDITADMVGTTSVPEINVGSALSTGGSTLYNEYARVRLGSTAILGYTTSNDPKSAQAIIGDKGTKFNVSYEDFTGHAKLATAFIPKDTIVFVTRVLGVGGSPAGTAQTKVIVDWF